MTVIDIGSVGELRKIVVESPTATRVVAVVVVNAMVKDRKVLNEAGGSDGTGWIGREWGRIQTRPNTGRKLSESDPETLVSSLFFTLACIFCSVFNRNPGVMAGLATSAGISSFITWSTCSGHRSLTCLRSLTTYTGARRGHLATHRPLDKAVTVNGPSQISRVRFSISRVSPPVLLTLHPTYWKPAALPRFYISVSAQGPVSSARC